MHKCAAHLIAALGSYCASVINSAVYTFSANSFCRPDMHNNTVRGSTPHTKIIINIYFTTQKFLAIFCTAMHVH